MLLLLDTHAFLWWVEGAPTLSSGARRAIGTSGNECLFSVASCWEMAIKLSLRKLRLDTPIERFVPEQAEAVGGQRSEEHTSELQSRGQLVCRLLLEKKKIE